MPPIRDSTLGFDLYGIAADAANSAYLYGSFNGTVNFNPGSGVKDFTSTADKSDFVISLLSNNTLAWAAQTGGAGVENSERMLAVEWLGQCLRKRASPTRARSPPSLA